MKDFNLRGYLSNNRLLESKEYEEEISSGVTPFYLIGDKEVSRDEVLAYKYENPEKPVADRGWPKWMYSNNNSEGKTLKWSTIKSDMKNLEKEYGEGNVVVGGSTNAGGPYIEMYIESQNQPSTVTEALNQEVINKVSRFITSMANYYDYPEESAIYAIVAALQGRMPSGAKLIIQNVEEPTDDMTEGSTEGEMSVSKEAGRLKAHPEKDTIGKIQALMALEKVNVGTSLESLEKLKANFSEGSLALAYLEDAITTLKAGEHDEFAEDINLFKAEVRRTIESSNSKVTDSIAESKALRKLMEESILMEENQKGMFVPRKVDKSSLDIDGVDESDRPDFVDAYFISGDYEDGGELSDEDLDYLTAEYPDVVNEMANQS